MSTFVRLVVLAVVLMACPFVLAQQANSKSVGDRPPELTEKQKALIGSLPEITSERDDFGPLAILFRTAVTRASKLDWQYWHDGNEQALLIVRDTTDGTPLLLVGRSRVLLYDPAEGRIVSIKSKGSRSPIFRFSHAEDNASLRAGIPETEDENKPQVVVDVQSFFEPLTGPLKITALDGGGHRLTITSRKSGGELRLVMDRTKTPALRHLILHDKGGRLVLGILNLETPRRLPLPPLSTLPLDKRPKALSLSRLEDMESPLAAVGDLMASIMRSVLLRRAADDAELEQLRDKLGNNRDWKALAKRDAKLAPAWKKFVDQWLEHENLPVNGNIFEQIGKVGASK